MPTRTDPVTSNHFRVEINGLTVSAFSSVTGISADVAVVQQRSGNDPAPGLQKQPGEASFPNVVLQRGFTGDLTLWTWMQTSINGAVTPRDVTVSVLDETNNEVARFTLRSAWPVRWSGPTLVADSNAVALETLEIAYESLAVAQ